VILILREKDFTTEITKGTKEPDKKNPHFVFFVSFVVSKKFYFSSAWRF
jgi:hypothetical protein